MNRLLPQKGPVVICPGCKTIMQQLDFSPATGGLTTVTFRCDNCGTETKREFKAEDGVKHRRQIHTNPNSCDPAPGMTPPLQKKLPRPREAS